MRNAAFQSFSTELCSLGNNDVQMLNSDVSMQLGRLNVYGGSFQMDSQMCNDDQLGPFAPLSSTEIPESFNYVPAGFLSTTSIYENTYQQPIFPNNKSFPTPQPEAGFEARPNVRKRSVRVGDPINKERTMKESKKTKVLCTEEQCHYRAIEQPLETQELREVPVRRSQKLGDRITALQKLVSPFGKTDTASVLQEASVCIKLLQEQIQMLSTPYFRVKPLHQQSFGEKQVDLQSRGLCLVPVSFTQKLDKQDHADHAISRRAIIPQNY